mgnify:CR=1 FL=1
MAACATVASAAGASDTAPADEAAAPAVLLAGERLFSALYLAILALLPGRRWPNRMHACGPPGPT